jgi:ATP-dependent Lhr-like helicase
VSLSAFHPIVARWFEESLGEPTSAQEQAWGAIRTGRNTVVAAPTGSGKTLAAFLTILDDLFQEGLQSLLPDEVRVVYVSPLKALSADIHKNLAEPRRGIRQLALQAGLDAPRITAAVRTGDTTSAERAAMLRTPPHVLVTTPESLYLLLTADRSRAMLQAARTVIVDEIHAVIGTRRGAHLALTLERLERVTGRRLLRIGLSATQKPIEEVARFLNGVPSSPRLPHIVDEGHRREMDLGLELPRSPLEAVMSREVWEELYERLTELIAAHRTTLVFVNTRRLAERLAHHLSERLGEDAVTAHHGSLSKEKRLDAEHRLKTGQLKALIATASLELGIDIGTVDLVCQIGSPRRISTLLQRVGRSGHTIAGLPKGRIFPLSRDDLVECAAILRAIRRGELDRFVAHEAPLDVLAQQIVAECSAADSSEDELFALVRRAWPYRDLPRADFDGVVGMLADGFATRRGRRAALVHRDEVNHRLRGRRGSRLLAVTSGGAIPEVADYRVILEPEETFIGTLNEDFAIESMAGDIFQLGNASWRVLQVGSGTVRVADARGAPPTIPFWFGEAPARSDELSREVSRLRAEIEARLTAGIAQADMVRWISADVGISAAAAEEIHEYFAEAFRVLGVLPTQESLVLERFFDEGGGMQLVLHAPLGSRINKAWGLALRKRFCRQFNFELQAAATDDALLLSLGPQHSFPLADVFRYLHPATARDVLVQAFLDAPVFQTRWRWNTTISLAVPRNRAGRKVAPQIQRMIADDLLAAVFPDAAACLENIPGDREVPDHPLVNQTVRDCLQEAMDFDGLAAVLARIHAGELHLVARDTPEPSVLCHDILNARPYAFLDDAPLEERRTRAVYARRASHPRSADDIGALDVAAIDRVRDEVRPDPVDPDELHDVLLAAAFLTSDEAVPLDQSLFARLAESRRAGRAGDLWIAAERLPELHAVRPGVVTEPLLAIPASRATRTWTRDEAIVEWLRCRMALSGPTTASVLAATFGIPAHEIDAGLLALESEGLILRGYFEPGCPDLQWCDRRLLARIHRYTLNRLRAEIEPVSAADYMRFLFAWQHVDPASRTAGLDGLRQVLGVLDGLELPARAWERAVLPARVEKYDRSMLDLLSLYGEVGWARVTPAPAAVNGSTPIALFLREHAKAWLGLRHTATPLSLEACRTLETLRTRGASFSSELAAACALDEERIGAALAELVNAGLVTSDAFGGLRARLRGSPAAARGRVTAGRWSAIDPPTADDERNRAEVQARALLRRYGVVFRRVLAREATLLPWRDLVRVLRQMEARGEIRGGRFVAGMSGEQFATPEAVERLREIRRTPASGRLLSISAADPLNLTGIVNPGPRVRASTANRIVYRDGVPLAAMEGDYVRPLADIPSEVSREIATALAGRRVPAVVAGYVGR